MSKLNNKALFEAFLANADRFESFVAFIDENVLIELLKNFNNKYSRVSNEKIIELLEDYDDEISEDIRNLSVQLEAKYMNNANQKHLEAVCNFMDAVEDALSDEINELRDYEISDLVREAQAYDVFDDYLD